MERRKGGVDREEKVQKVHKILEYKEKVRKVKEAFIDSSASSYKQEAHGSGVVGDWMWQTAATVGWQTATVGGSSWSEAAHG